MFTKDQIAVIRSAVSDKLTDLRILLTEYTIQAEAWRSRLERLDDFDISNEFSKKYYEQERSRYKAQINRVENEMEQLRDVLKTIST